MKEKVNFFTADYRDGRVNIAGKTFPAGHFVRCTQCQGQFLKDKRIIQKSVV